MTDLSKELSAEYLVNMVSLVEAYDRYSLIDAFKPSLLGGLLGLGKRAETLKKECTHEIYALLTTIIFILIDENDNILKRVSTADEKIDILINIFNESVHKFKIRTINTDIFKNIKNDVNTMIDEIQNYSDDEQFEASALNYMKMRCII